MDPPAIPDLHHCEIQKPVHGWMGPVDVGLDNWIGSGPSLAERYLQRHCGGNRKTRIGVDRKTRTGVDREGPLSVERATHKEAEQSALTSPKTFS